VKLYLYAKKLYIGFILTSVISKSVARIFEVLELFSRTQQPMRAVEIQKALDYPQPSTLALLKNLVELKYLSFDRVHKTYFPTLELARLAQWVEPALVGQGWLAQIADELSIACNETASVIGQNNIHSQIIYVHKAEHPLALQVEAGLGAPLCATSVGRAILSLQGDEQIEALIAETNKLEKRSGSKIHHDMQNIMVSIRTIREKGYLSTYDLYIKGVGTIVFPLPADFNGHPIAIAVAGTTERIREQETFILRTLRTTIQRYIPQIDQLRA